MYKIYTEISPGREPWVAKLLLTMKLTMVIIIAALMQVSAASFGQRLTLQKQNNTIETVIREIRKQMGYDVLFSTGKINTSSKINAKFLNAPLEEVMDKLLEGKDLTYTIELKTIIIKPKSLINKVLDYIKAIDVKGKVLDEKGVALPNASILIRGTNRMIRTDEQGRFQLNGIPEDTWLVVSYIGYKSQEIKATSGEMITVILQQDEKLLKEVTVSTGYQTFSKERSAGSFGKADMNVVNNRSTSMNIVQRLDGLIPGLVLNNAPSAIDNGKADPTTKSNILIRGLNSINAARAPLYVVDGIAVNDVADINPNDVQDVMVLKDATAASIWGSRASNGVIVIVSKKGGQSDKVKIEYDAFLNLRGKPDMDYIPYMRSAEFISTAKEIFNPTAYPYATVMAPNAFGGTAVVAPHEMILYKQYLGKISPAVANAQLDSLAAIDNRSQIKDTWYRNAALMNHTLSVRGGTANYGFYGSVAYTNTMDNSPGNQNDAYKINARQDFTFNKRISAYLITNLIYNTTGSKNTQGVSTRFLPYQLFKDAAGNRISMPWLWRTDSLTNLYQSKSMVNLNYNPLDEFDYKKTRSNTLRGSLTSGVTVKILKGLRFEGVYGFTRGSSKTSAYTDQNSFDTRNELVQFTVPAIVTGGLPTYYLPVKGGKLLTSNLNQKNWTVRNQLVYDNSFNNNLHQLTLLAGQEATASLFNTISNTVRGYDPQLLTSQGVDYVTLGTGIANTVISNNFGRSILGYDVFAENETEARTTSFYGNLAYTYFRKYTLNASLRNDQSNLFGKDKSAQNKPLWSVGLAWNLGTESFMSKMDWLNHLSLRATYGLTGNQPLVGSSASYDILTAITSTTAPGGSYLALSTYANRQLSWESTKTTNLGLDFMIFRNRLSGSLDYYSKNTENLIGSLPVNSFTGTTSIVGNLGNMTNKGIEARITGLNIEQKNFGWSTTLTLAYNKNKLTKLNQSITSVSVLTTSNYVMGYPAFAQFAYDFAGLDNLGDPQIRLADGTVTKGINAANIKDMKYMGSFQPKLTGGFQNNFRYKSFGLGLNMVYSFGAVLRRDVLGQTTFTGVLGGRMLYPNPGTFQGNIYQDFANRWKVEGDETLTDIPSYVANASQNTSRRNLSYYTYGDINFFDGAYIKMRDINLSYDLPKRIASALNVEGITFRATVSNILLWTANKYGIDPEFHDGAGGTRVMPTGQHSFTIGAHVKF